MPRRGSMVGLLLLGWLSLVASPSHAQQGEPDPDDPATGASMQIGPVFLSPSFRIQDMGIDENIFNDDEQPE